MVNLRHNWQSKQNRWSNHFSQSFCP